MPSRRPKLDFYVSYEIQAGRPLYLDHFRRAGSRDEARYVVGERNGLTSVRIL